MKNKLRITFDRCITAPLIFLSIVKSLSNPIEATIKPNQAIERPYLIIRITFIKVIIALKSLYSNLYFITISFIDTNTIPYLCEKVNSFCEKICGPGDFPANVKSPLFVSGVGSFSVALGSHSVSPYRVKSLIPITTHKKGRDFIFFYHQLLPRLSSSQR